MTTPSKRPRPLRYALLLNGANFACEVLHCLQQSAIAPTSLVLPEYAPASEQVDNPVELIQARPRRRLLSLAGTIPIAYAPLADQAGCARLLRQQAIDFLLVACWPYLIDPVLINSAANAALNLHPSLLPLYRGPDPIGQQLASDDRRFGVTLHLLSSRFDQGDIVAQARLQITASTTARRSIEKQAAQQGSKLFIDAINEYDDGWRTPPQAQTIQTENGIG